jgi:hypothetical protein
MRPLGIALVALGALALSAAAAAPGAASPAGFVRFMELSRFPFEHLIAQDTRASFFLMSDWLFIEIFFVDEQDTFEIRRSNAYIEGTSGPEFMSCERRGPGVPSDSERVAYVRRWFEFVRHDGLLFVIPKCLADIPAARRGEAEEIRARFLAFIKTYSPGHAAVLEREFQLERANIEELRDIVLNSRHDLRQRAEELMARISSAALAAVRRGDPEFADMLHYLLVIQPRVEEKERLQAAEEAAFIAKNYPASIVPELALAPAGSPQVIVSLVNRSDSPVWALINGGMLAPDRGNVHFLVWRPGALQPSEYRPYLWVADVFYDSMSLGPGESISHIYDLSGHMTESGLYRLQAVVAYGGAARTNSIEITRGALTDENYIPHSGASISQSESGTVRIELLPSATYDHWREYPQADSAPQWRLAPPWPNWEMTARVRAATPSTKVDFHAGLFVLFSQYDIFYWGNYQNRDVRLERSGRREIVKIATESVRDVDLRIIKNGDRYTFSTKPAGAAGWIDAGIDICADTPAFVGLIAKSWSPVHVVMDVVDFHLVQLTER